MDLHVAVTGASSGIGEAMARDWVKAGARVTLVSRRREVLEKLAADVGGRTHVAPQDLSDAARACDWIAGAEAALGPIDVLVNNAGIENTGPFVDADPQEGLKVLVTNLHTPVLLCRAVLPGMLARKRGVLVNVASLAGIAPLPIQVWYGASKCGLAGFSEALHGELRGSGVHVLTIYPGPVRTAMADRAYEAFGGRKGLAGLMPEGTPEVLARRARKAVMQRSTRMVYPRIYVMARWFPVMSRGMINLFAPRPTAALAAAAARFVPASPTPPASASSSSSSTPTPSRAPTPSTTKQPV